MREIDCYRADPCRYSSIPYWKTLCTKVPQDMRILHQEDFSAALLKQYTDEPYFRLIHGFVELEQPKLAEEFAVCGATIPEFAEHIDRCYDGIGISTDKLRGYKERKVYAPELWLAVCDRRTGKIVATGIAELDQEIREGVQEWIQVLPEYRGRGLGKFLVLELLRRMKPTADFATVSGQCNNPTSPEQLYRKCGFTGYDVWHILRRLKA